MCDPQLLAQLTQHNSVAAVAYPTLCCCSLVNLPDLCFNRCFPWGQQAPYPQPLTLAHWKAGACSGVPVKCRVVTARVTYEPSGLGNRKQKGSDSKAVNSTYANNDF